jgi:hypothetical protein
VFAKDLARESPWSPVPLQTVDYGPSLVELAATRPELKATLAAAASTSQRRATSRVANPGASVEADGDYEPGVVAAWAKALQAEARAASSIDAVAALVAPAAAAESSATAAAAAFAALAAARVSPRRYAADDDGGDDDGPDAHARLRCDPSQLTCSSLATPPHPP